MSYASEVREAMAASYGILGEAYGIFPAGTGGKMKYSHTSGKGREGQEHCFELTLPNQRVITVWKRQLSAIHYRNASN